LAHHETLTILPQSRPLECGSLLPLCSADLQVGTFLISHRADLKVSATAPPASELAERQSGSKLPHSKALRARDTFR